MTLLNHANHEAHLKLFILCTKDYIITEYDIIVDFTIIFTYSILVWS